MGEKDKRREEEAHNRKGGSRHSTRTKSSSSSSSSAGSRTRHSSSRESRSGSSSGRGHASASGRPRPMIHQPVPVCTAAASGSVATTLNGAAEYYSMRDDAAEYYSPRADGRSWQDRNRIPIPTAAGGPGTEAAVTAGAAYEQWPMYAATDYYPPSAATDTGSYTTSTAVHPGSIAARPTEPGDVGDYYPETNSLGGRPFYETGEEHATHNDRGQHYITTRYMEDCSYTYLAADQANEPQPRDFRIAPVLRLIDTTIPPAAGAYAQEVATYPLSIIDEEGSYGEANTGTDDAGHGSGNGGYSG